jgi:lipopolysaccharide export system permease protein
MTLLERYIFKIAASAFLLCLGGLTGVIWISSAIREMDLVSGKGQTLWVFLQVTLLTLPALVMVIAPIALFGAVLYTLNKLNTDSELIVMNAAGMAPARVARPLGILTVLVALLTAYITIFAMPNSFRTLRDMLTKIRADVVTKFIQEGRFTTIDKGITFHYREKSPSGAMLGVMIHDARDPQKQTTYLAERGRIIDNDGAAYMVLEAGSIHRQQDASRDNAIIAYDRYAIDLDQFGADGEKIIYKPRERTTYELLNADESDPYYKLQAGRFRAELHERFAGPLYSFACMLIGFAALGGAKTTRQGRGTAIAAAIVAMVALRIVGFGATSLATRSAAFTSLIYLAPVGASAAAALVAWRSMSGVVRAPAFVTKGAEWLEEALMRGGRWASGARGA